ncbi:MAG: DNA polymerase I, partial [Candidatus Rokubacteria bacterium]|nr:DNA polymerase I [Candidatus Rokubacteria bacterium]
MKTETPRRRTLYVVDGYSHLFRAYHAVGYLSTSKGVPSHAVLILSTMLWKLIREEQPDFLGIAWDAPGPTFRDSLFADYKATRTRMPDDLVRQLPYVHRLFEALRTPVIQVPGYEADDVLATVVDKALAADLDVVIVTGDKDMLQLVGPRVRVLSVLGRTGERVVYDEAKVRERWGVEPAQIADVLALMGDAIDNIPGVRGVGEKTAVKLIAQFGSVARLYDNLTLVGGKLRETLAAGRKDALLSRELIVLNHEVPVALDLEQFRRVEPDWPKLRGLWMEMEFARLLKELPTTTVDVSAEPVATLADEAAVHAWLARVPDGTAIALDWAGEAKPPEPRLTGLAVFHPAAGAATLAPALGATVAASGRELVIHDGKPLLEAWLGRGVAPPPIHDSAVAAYLLNPARQTYRLDEICMEAFGDCPPPLPTAPTDQLGSILGARARWLARYWEHAQAELAEHALASVYAEIERPLIPVLALMERTGIRVDPRRLEEFAKELERSLDNLTREIYALAGEPFTIASPKQLAQVLFEKLKLPALRKTKTGYSTDADVLTELALGHPLPAKILEHRILSKLKGTYADALPVLVNPVTGRIHTTFNQLVAATGRLSSQDPNLMNIPIRTELGRRIRAAFIPEPGWRFVAADYSQIELRILAHLSGEPAIIESFARGEDIHTRTASEVFKVAPGEVTGLQRTIAKSANYAILYGVSAFGLSQATKIDRKEAERYIAEYFRTHPAVRAFIDRTL